MQIRAIQQEIIDCGTITLLPEHGTDLMKELVIVIASQLLLIEDLQEDMIVEADLGITLEKDEEGVVIEVEAQDLIEEAEIEGAEIVEML